ncbi:type II toxin-antitoxin system VapB family antitoxin [Streptomyces parvus]|uniref:type II toxin-antitoxin system VapB family antitoxin n=1 Tax=Streptomyces parvus TaxID=66428 RepID=UPI0021015310|nr:type II toxin-antitoxin system VapB family antitoxin [Streptomyces parvus]MCQ1579342.1 type II toxin-antitoxin system VapB family antitoxin [Streptomyces parvus]
MSKTTVDIDPELLAAAKARLGTQTIKETINAALREIAQRGEREEAIDDLASMISDGEIDWNVLDDKGEYRPVPHTPPRRGQSHRQPAKSPTEVEAAIQKATAHFRESVSSVAAASRQWSPSSMVLPGKSQMMKGGIVLGRAFANPVVVEAKGTTDLPAFDIRVPSLLGSLDLTVLTDLRDRLGAIPWNAVTQQVSDDSLEAVDEARLLLDQLVVAATEAAATPAEVEADGDAG